MNDLNDSLPLIREAGEKFLVRACKSAGARRVVSEQRDSTRLIHVKRGCALTRHSHAYP